MQAVLLTSNSSRHGSRLDAVDKEWHRTSPTPYDSPLTYGGWIQAKALGARIASILTTNSSPTSSGASSASAASTSKLRKYRIVVHSSPFLRCIQTSVAIAAGISQSNPVPASTIVTSPTATPVSDSADAANCTVATLLPVITSSQPLQKVLLRLDPFLGEWLNPEYFEGITSPPKCNLMLAGAKADLLRKETYEWATRRSGTPISHASKPSNGALWTSPAVSVASPVASKPMSGVARATLAGGRDILVQSGTSSSSVSATPSPSSTPPPAPAPGYVAPTPDYAVGIACPIPKGFVAHARDACVVSDYQWDSSREPFDWGNGGNQPEEWTAMHKRIRHGLQRLVDWYANNDDAIVPVTVTESDVKKSTDEDGADVETVVIVVSHGAGCNAMIGAITNKPVLLDVNVAALTMASMRPQEQLVSQSSGTIGQLARSVQLDKTYTITILANTDHYRPSRGGGSSTPPPVMSWGGISPYRSRVSSMSASMRPVVIRPSAYNISDGMPGVTPPHRFEEDISRRDRLSNLVTNISLGSDAPTNPKATASSRQLLFATPPNMSPLSTSAPLFDVPRSGLWAPPPTKISLLENDGEDENDVDNMLPDFEHKRLSSSSAAGKTTANDEPRSIITDILTSPSSAGQSTTTPTMDIFGLSSTGAPRDLAVLLPPVELMTALVAAGNEEAIDNVSALVQPALICSGLWENSPRPETLKRRWTVNER